MLGVLVGLTWTYWILGCSIYSIKFLSTKFNELTSYGKLLSPSVQGAVPHSIAWPAFYIFGVLWNSGVIMLQVYVVCTKNLDNFWIGL